MSTYLAIYVAHATPMTIMHSLLMSQQNLCMSCHSFAGCYLIKGFRSFKCFANCISFENWKNEVMSKLSFLHLSSKNHQNPYPPQPINTIKQTKQLSKCHVEKGLRSSIFDRTLPMLLPILTNWSLLTYPGKIWQDILHRAWLHYGTYAFKIYP